MFMNTYYIHLSARNLFHLNLVLKLESYGTHVLASLLEKEKRQSA